MPETARIGKAALEAPGLGRDAPSGHDHGLGDRGRARWPRTPPQPLWTPTSTSYGGMRIFWRPTHADHQGAVSSSRSLTGPG